MIAVVFRKLGEITSRTSFDSKLTVTLELYGGPVGSVRIGDERIRCQLHAGNRQCTQLFGEGLVARVKDAADQIVGEAAIGNRCIQRYFPADSQIHRDARELDRQVDMDELRDRLAKVLADPDFLPKVDAARASAVRCAERFTDLSGLGGVPEPIQKRLRHLAKQGSGSVSLMVAYFDENSNRKRVKKWQRMNGPAISGLSIWGPQRRRAIFDRLSAVRKAHDDESDMEVLDNLRSRVIALEDLTQLSTKVDEWRGELDAFMDPQNCSYVCFLSNDHSVQKPCARWVLRTAGQKDGSWEADFLLQEVLASLSASFNGSEVRAAGD